MQMHGFARVGSLLAAYRGGMSSKSVDIVVIILSCALRPMQHVPVAVQKCRGRGG